MMKQEIVIAAEAGFHARPASIFAKKAMGYQCDINISCEGKEINGKSIMSILTLGAAKGSVVTLTCEGADEAEAMAELAAFIETMD
ncbi:HPr family phosphocarrier protein [Fusibacter paucivorans]|uniref:HPr family phosphocarrier protein n=2 Tax=Fusibacter paucivorans TaxID=76009 RepID=A0ABS5PJZ2_9FIRM|nr:HPr family phosphocarrier protein [Fusibacter paucivorans]